MALVEAFDLRKTFGQTVAVDNISLRIASGEIYGLVGSDGAGKTTTIRLICGALRPNAGKATVCGYDIQKQTEQARAHIGYLSQRFSMYEDLTVLENIRFFAEVRGMKADQWRPRCMEILEFVGLADFIDRRAGQLSGGMKQKLGLASALVTRPRVLLLDEPTTGVDPVTRQDFWQLIMRLVALPTSPMNGDAGKSEASILLTTPYMDEASRCHHIGFMKDGKIIAEGAPSALCATLDGRILELRGGPIALLRKIAHHDEDVEDVQAFGDRLHVRVGKGKAKVVLGRLKSQIQHEGGTVSNLRTIPPVLEDVFMALAEQNHV